MAEEEKKRYSEDGCLIVSELGRCPFFEKDASSARLCGSDDCYFCKYSDFRKREYIERVDYEARRGVLYSICHNEHNRRILN